MAAPGLKNGPTHPDRCYPPAVEGGGQVKAELVSVGQSGEKSLKRIETAGDKTSGGLTGTDHQKRNLNWSEARGPCRGPERPPRWYPARLHRSRPRPR
jgi:hypothetical protein